jgi:hypothetical protein
MSLPTRAPCSTNGNRAQLGNYYRIDGPTFLVEYDNTQNQRNHTHSVWRDLNCDFGIDTLGDHNRLEHQAASPAGWS